MIGNRNDITILPFEGKVPRIHESAFIAPGCRIIGDVEIGPDVSIWYNCVLRGDVNRIVIGARSNVQDGTVIHCDGPDEQTPEGFPTIIGEDVLIGHMAMIHGCTLDDRSFVGLGAIVLNGARVETDGMLAAGAQLTSGKTIPPGEIWAGRPAKFLRAQNEEALAKMNRSPGRYVEYSRRHKAALAAMEAETTGDGAATR